MNNWRRQRWIQYDARCKMHDHAWYAMSVTSCMMHGHASCNIHDHEATCHDADHKKHFIHIDHGVEQCGKSMCNFSRDMNNTCQHTIHGKHVPKIVHICLSTCSCSCAFSLRIRFLLALYFNHFSCFSCTILPMPIAVMFLFRLIIHSMWLFFLIGQFRLFGSTVSSCLW